MTIIRQPSLFSIQELYDIEPTQKYDAIISGIDLDKIYHIVTKKSRLGAPEELNYAAMIISIFVRYIEQIPMIKDLIKRLRSDIAFKLNCGFLLSDTIPSKSSYSRLITKLEESNILEMDLENVVLQAIEEGFITDDTVAIDATHFEARDQAPQKEEKPKPEPKKRGRKSKEERDEWLKEQAEKEANLSLYEKKIEVQLDTPLDELRAEIPSDPKWGVKRNSEGKNVFWFGYKGHLAVGTSSQYILQAVFSSGNLNDGKMAIPLLKGIHENLSLSSLCYQTMDAGYDYESIYEQVHRMGHRSIIAYNRRNEGEPKECKDCPVASEGICQKVFKMKITTDLRKYSAPALGSMAWKNIFKRRTAVERVNAYLKEFFQLNNVRYRTGKRAKIHFDMVTLIYNASKLVADRINAQLNQQRAA